jgi:hypothetical protein
MATITLNKFVIHDGSDKQTTLTVGQVECVFTIDGAGGQGMNFASVEALDEFIASRPNSDEAAAIRSALLKVQETDPTYKSIDAVKGVELETPKETAEIKV